MSIDTITSTKGTVDPITSTTAAAPGGSTEEAELDLERLISKIQQYQENPSQDLLKQIGDLANKIEAEMPVTEWPHSTCTAWMQALVPAGYLSGDSHPSPGYMADLLTQLKDLPRPPI